MTVKRITSAQAFDRLQWLMHSAGGDLSSTAQHGDCMDEKTVEALRDIATVARQVALHYELLETEEAPRQIRADGGPSPLSGNGSGPMEQTSERIAEAERRGAVKALRSAARKGRMSGDLFSRHCDWLDRRAFAIEHGADL